MQIIRNMQIILTVFLPTSKHTGTSTSNFLCMYFRICRGNSARPFSQIQTDELSWHPIEGTRLRVPPTSITCRADSRNLGVVGWSSVAVMDTYQQYPSQMLMNWGVFLNDQGAVPGGQGVYTDPWSNPVSTVNTVSTVTSLLKNGQTIFSQDWNTVPINGYNTVSPLF
jgi:hypothetical protein